jgi:hypothetical protein
MRLLADGEQCASVNDEDAGEIRTKIRTIYNG